ncbi:hypothetical protein [Yimella sp. cx-51]|uniref:hypothetical protein n=1 Tax=Yimella sp. cx-51 TaxID=2770551 RepID=UPI00165DF11D|nr:hypothetical protein [Yimella sp. cx-51]MBC9956552.1 hypothetical protein [Yimella sp. cx-51]QTH38344.1 hypothetical protein J5M86_01245 [Yimella sp. cx-51]
MSDELEQRLRASLQARADQVDPEDLDASKRDDLLTQLRRSAPENPTRTGLVTKIALAGAAAGVAVLAASGQINLPGGSGQDTMSNASAPAAGTAAASRPTSGEAGFAVPGGFVQGPASTTVSVGNGETLTLTPVFTIDDGKVTISVEMTGTTYATPVAFAYSVDAPDGAGLIEDGVRMCDRGSKRTVDTTRTFGTYELGGREVSISTFGCTSAGQPVELRWKGSVLPSPR